LEPSWLSIVDELYKDAWNAELHRFRSPYAFRGVGCATHSLTSTLTRLAGGRADIRKLELALLRNFRKYARTDANGADSTWDWLALGQHRGLPTRLLDWTYSPLVALHFATENPATFDRDGVVWSVNFVEANRRIPRKLQRILKEEASDTFTAEMLAPFGTLREFEALSRHPFLVFLEPPALDQRILNQLALFSLMSDPSGSFEDWIKTHPDLYRRVIVPARLKWEIRDKLDQANINERVLFPGLDGLSRWLTRYYTPGNGDASESEERFDPNEPVSAQLKTLRSTRARGRATSRSRSPASRRRSGGSGRAG
jgi:hypothetical protein